MSDDEQASHFANEIDALVERYRKEYDISYCALVGVLNMKIWLLCNEATGRRDET